MRSFVLTVIDQQDTYPLLDFLSDDILRRREHVFVTAEALILMCIQRYLHRKNECRVTLNQMLGGHGQATQQSRISERLYWFVHASSILNPKHTLLEKDPLDPNPNIARIWQKEIKILSLPLNVRDFQILLDVSCKRPKMYSNEGVLLQDVWIALMARLHDRIHTYMTSADGSRMIDKKFAFRCPCRSSGCKYKVGPFAVNKKNKANFIGSLKSSMRTHFGQSIDCGLAVMQMSKDFENWRWETLVQHEPIEAQMWKEFLVDRDESLSKGVLKDWYNNVGKGLPVPVELETLGFSNDANNNMLHTRLELELEYDGGDKYQADGIIVAWATPALSNFNEHHFLFREIGTEGFEVGWCVLTLTGVRLGLQRLRNNSNMINSSSSSSSSNVSVKSSQKNSSEIVMSSATKKKKTKKKKTKARKNVSDSKVSNKKKKK